MVIKLIVMLKGDDDDDDDDDNDDYDNHHRVFSKSEKVQLMKLLFLFFSNPKAYFDIKP